MSILLKLDSHCCCWNDFLQFYAGEFEIIYSSQVTKDTVWTPYFMEYFACWSRAPMYTPSAYLAVRSSSRLIPLVVVTEAVRGTQSMRVMRPKLTEWTDNLNRYLAAILRAMYFRIMMSCTSVESKCVSCRATLGLADSICGSYRGGLL